MAARKAEAATPAAAAGVPDQKVAGGAAGGGTAHAAGLAGWRPHFDLRAQLPKLGDAAAGPRAHRLLGEADTEALTRAMLAGDARLHQLVDALARASGASSSHPDVLLPVYDDAEPAPEPGKPPAEPFETTHIYLMHICDAQGRPQAPRRNGPDHASHEAVWVSDWEAAEKQPLYIHPRTGRVHRAALPHGRHSLAPLLAYEAPREGDLLFQHGSAAQGDPESLLCITLELAIRVLRTLPRPPDPASLPPPVGPTGTRVRAPAPAPGAPGAKLGGLFSPSLRPWRGLDAGGRSPDADDPSADPGAAWGAIGARLSWPSWAAPAPGAPGAPAWAALAGLGARPAWAPPAPAPAPANTSTAARF
jgi:hypothetical protein